MVVSVENINKAIDKTCEFLISKQREDGSWSYDDILPGEPMIYHKPLMHTSEAIQTLIFSKNHKFIPNIMRGIHFCSNVELCSKDSVDLWAWKLMTLNFSNSKLIESEKKKIISFITSSQNKNGFWSSFPSTSNLTNYSAITAIRNYNKKKSIESARKWFIKSKAKDGLGWGFDDKAEQSESTFTANVVLALLYSGENPKTEELQAARTFLESKQLKDGGWPSSKYTVADRSTTYATAIILHALICLSEDPFNKIIESGVKYLINCQAKDGGWPLVKSAHKPEFYTAFYAVRTLSIYKYLLEKFNNNSLSRLIKTINCPQHLTEILISQFDEDLIKDFKLSAVCSVIDSKVLGITDKAVERRLDILSILSCEGEKEIAEIIDSLKKQEKYSFLNKKTHITQIKSDIEFLRGLNIVEQTSNNKYYVVIDLFN